MSTETLFCQSWFALTADISRFLPKTCPHYLNSFRSTRTTFAIKRVLKRRRITLWIATRNHHRSHPAQSAEAGVLERLLGCVLLWYGKVKPFCIL